MKIINYSILTLLFTGCATQHPEVIEPKYSTPECKSYHSMATAPIAPNAIEALRTKCMESLQNKSN